MQDISTPRTGDDNKQSSFQNNNEEHSGVHEIRELAKRAKQEADARMVSKTEERAAYLSGHELAHVALPLAGYETKPMEQAVQVPYVPVAHAGQSVTSTLGVSDSTRGRNASQPVVDDFQFEKKSRSWPWIAVVVGACALAAGAWSFMAGDTQKPAEEKSVVLNSEPAIKPVAAKPKIAPLAVVDKSKEVSNDDSDKTVEPIQDAPKELAETSAKSIKSKTLKKQALSAASSSSPKEVKQKNNKNSQDDSPTVNKVVSKKDHSPNKDSAKPIPKGASLDDVLSSVTGGAATHQGQGNEPEEKKSKPSKTKLDRSDVAKAMAKVSPKAKSCHKAESHVGTVSVKFSVAPDGNISKAKALGSHGTSKTGACVVKAVKGATFPAFDGRPTSFTFPFLLSK